MPSSLSGRPYPSGKVGRSRRIDAFMARGYGGPMTVLTPELLERIRARAAGYDRDNAFFTDDLDELRAAGYLAPRSLLETARDQRLLAAYAPATALGINMHLVWVGVARV